ncbi:RNA polymerase sigma-70 factor [Cohnella zeiphila]|uniref:RNA polymerase sigma-70 factor n=1 Tax=Cohnella zeiphila TaxID=2761120 RepID=A0A7X0VWN5_9BACL|nr:RNA polymerase sigma-70 factor [Cohnella zeiphila]MBB6733161.1 RNA polymerase sigma-70 factor [Cohnella zeiphila]
MEDALLSGLYASYKPLLFTLAYRMLGSVMDAEDAAQEAFLSLNETSDPERIRNPKAYLCKTVTNRCIDRLRSSQAKREVYVGPWLPEPLVSRPDGEDDPYGTYARRESLSTAFLLLLDQLSAVERAVFLLREALQYDYAEIAAIVDKSPANCRQIYHRAKRSLGELPRTDPDAKTAPHAELPGTVVDQFIGALATGNVGKLMDLLTSDAVLLSDGGGKVTAATRPILGPDRIMRFLAGLLEKIPPGFSSRSAEVGGEPGFVTYVDGKPQSVFSFLMEDGRIKRIYLVANPDKLVNVP